MVLKREWATPLTIGAFLLSAVTGVLLFFKIDVGLSKLAHEWLSWALLAGVVVHVVTNFKAFKYHLTTRTGRWVVGLFVVALTASFFIPAAGGGEPPFMPPVRALGRVPMTTLAQVAGVSPEQLRERLARVGVQPTSDAQSVSELVGSDLRKQMPVLAAAFSSAP